eukprot:1123550-Pelagomonas_calceolata.AAC.2
MPLSVDMLLFLPCLLCPQLAPRAVQLTFLGRPLSALLAIPAQADVAQWKRDSRACPQPIVMSLYGT